MKILIFVNTKQRLENPHNLGGIEILNFELFNYLKNKHEVFFSKKVSQKLVSISWDIVISSNDARVFNKLKSKRKILWLHNKLQIEKALRKKQLLSILFNKIEAVFVSNYLKKNTSIFYNFVKREVIPNSLPSIFEYSKFPKTKQNNKNLFVWSVQRKKGLDELINVWKNKIYPLNLNCELHIFGINFKNKNFDKYKIFNYGKIPRNKLLNFYKKSVGMICLGYDETFCLNAIEAMKMGLPVISLGKTALKDIIKHKKNGYLIDRIDNIDKSIIDLVNLGMSKKKMLSRSCSKFASNYNSKTIFQKWDKLIYLS